MNAAPSDRLAASVFLLGLTHRFLRRQDIVAWADRRIVETEIPPEWMFNLSLSQDKHVLDLVGELHRLADRVDPDATCNAIYALLPDAVGYSFDQAAALAERIYRITYDCLNGDWSHRF